MKTYRCQISVVEDNGRYFAEALNFPGVIIPGDTEAEAIEDCCDCIVGTIEAMQETDEPIPSVESPDVPAGAKTAWVDVNV